MWAFFKTLKPFFMATTLTLLSLGLLELGIRLGGWAETTQSTSPLAFQGLPPITQKTTDPTYTRYQGGRARLAKTEPTGKRVFIVGGSAAYGDGYTPYMSMGGHLERWLNRAYAMPIEVINLSQGGIASAQVTTVIESLLKYETPDLIVVYSGNNEFHALRAEKYGNPHYDCQLIRTRRLLSQSHIYRLLKDHLLPEPPVAKIDPDEAPPNIAQLETEVDECDRRVVEENYAANLQKMADMAAQAGVPIIFGTLSDNLLGTSSTRDFPNHLRDDFDKLFEDSSAMDEGDIITFFEAHSELEMSSHAHHMIGQYYIQQRQNDLALKYLLKAERLDPKPVRSNYRMRQSLRALEAEGGQALCDIEHRLFAHLGHFPGQDIYNDPCHPNAHGHHLIGGFWAQCILSQSLLGPADDATLLTEIEAELQKRAQDSPLYLDGTQTRRKDGGHLSQNAPQPGQGGAANWVELGHQAYLQDRYMAAMDYYQQALEAGQSPGIMHWNRALTALHLDDVDLMRQELTLAKEKANLDAARLEFAANLE